MKLWRISNDLYFAKNQDRCWRLHHSQRRTNGECHHRFNRNSWTRNVILGEGSFPTNSNSMSLYGRRQTDFQCSPLGWIFQRNTFWVDLSAESTTHYYEVMALGNYRRSKNEPLFCITIAVITEWLKIPMVLFWMLFVGHDCSEQSKVWSIYGLKRQRNDDDKVHSFN